MLGAVATLQVGGDMPGASATDGGEGEAGRRGRAVQGQRVQGHRDVKAKLACWRRPPARVFIKTTYDRSNLINRSGFCSGTLVEIIVRRACPVPAPHAQRTGRGLRRAVRRSSPRW